MFPSNLEKNTNFPNMAGRVDCDTFIAEELKRAGISLKKQKSTSEVPYHIAGELPGFTFERAWYYWMARGNVPLDVAIEMYNDPLGYKDVRVAGYGYAGNTDPLLWAEYYDDEGYEYVSVCAADREKPVDKQRWIKRKEGTNIDENGEEIGIPALSKGNIPPPDLSHLEGYIHGYHIDSQAGLDYFITTLKAHRVI